MMTEADAKTKLCPMTRSGDDDNKCLAAECMAWRWARPHPVALVSKPMAPEEIEALRAAGSTSFLEIRDEDQKPIIVPNMGFCGMAGPSDRVP